MAKPRVFISSTYYDLKQIRSDIEKFVKDLGYEPVLSEKGHIPYGTEDRLEEYCYKEISKIDILVAIIGGKFGSQSQNDNASISQMEIKTALEQSKQIYLFIDKNVNTEYEIYQMNKDTNFITRYVDNVKVHEFIEFIHCLPKNNAMFEFDNAFDILLILKEQWAGLFQRFLQERTRLNEFMLVKDLKNTANTLNQLVTYLTEENKSSSFAIQEILLSDHPAMEQIKKVLNVDYRVYYTNFEELTQWLAARGYLPVVSSQSEHYLFFQNIQEKNKKKILKLNKNLFLKDGKLKVVTKKDWDSGWIALDIENTKDELEDLPF